MEEARRGEEDPMSQAERMTEYELIPSPISWDEVLMDRAFGVARKSKDPSTQVGCVVVSPNKRHSSDGYNGFPAKSVPDYWKWWENRDRDGEEFCKYDLVNHAEVNAILQARTDLTGWSLYCTHRPCLDCMRLIVTAEIKAVYYVEDDTTMDVKREKTDRLCEMAGVKLTRLEKPKGR